MLQKIFLIGEIYLFCIYFSFNNFNYPNKKLVKITKFFRGIPAKLLRKKQILLGFWGLTPFLPTPCSIAPLPSNLSGSIAAHLHFFSTWLDQDLFEVHVCMTGSTMISTTSTINIIYPSIQSSIHLFRGMHRGEMRGTCLTYFYTLNSIFFYFDCFLWIKV